MTLVRTIRDFGTERVKHAWYDVTEEYDGILYFGGNWFVCWHFWHGRLVNRWCAQKIEKDTNQGGYYTIQSTVSRYCTIGTFLPSLQKILRQFLPLNAATKGEVIQSSYLVSPKELCQVPICFYFALIQILKCFYVNRNCTLCTYNY